MQELFEKKGKIIFYCLENDLTKRHCCKERSNLYLGRSAMHVIHLFIALYSIEIASFLAMTHGERVGLITKKGR
jgi:hypothetical protein